jgi:predicted transglutaminase-like cysteine proteinase
MRWLRIVGAVSLLGLFASGVRAQDLAAIPPIPPPDQLTAFMQTFGAAEPPHGFVAFCQQEPDECTATSKAEKPVAVSATRLRELDEVNRWVNQSITPQTDFDHYGVKEYWAIPRDGKGDCEDYALLKRHMLMQRGWPSSALLITVVIDENKEGHAVLTALTQAGDLILDNRSMQIRLWSKTPYEFVMRQSPRNPQMWVYLGPALDEAPAPIAVLRPQR